MKTYSLRFPCVCITGTQRGGFAFAQLQTLSPVLETHDISQSVRLLDMINLAKKPYPLMKDKTRQGLRQTYIDELSRFSELFSDGVDYQAEWN